MIYAQYDEQYGQYGQNEQFYTGFTSETKTHLWVNFQAFSVIKMKLQHEIMLLVDLRYNVSHQELQLLNNGLISCYVNKEIRVFRGRTDNRVTSCEKVILDHGSLRQ